MAEKKPQPQTNPSESLPDSDTSNDEQVNTRLRTSAKERDYGTICSSAIATQIVWSYSTTQTNPTVERGSQTRQRRVKKLSKDKSMDKTTQTEQKDNQPK